MVPNNVQHEMSPEMVRITALEHDISRCQNDMNMKITHINNKLEEQTSLRALMNDKLDSIASQTRKNFDMLHVHTSEEMEKYERIIENIDALTKMMVTIGSQTKENTKFKESELHKREVEKRVQAELEVLEAPRKELWHKVKMTAVSVITVAALGASWTAVEFVIELSKIVKGG